LRRAGGGSAAAISPNESENSREFLPGWAMMRVDKFNVPTNCRKNEDFAEVPSMGENHLVSDQGHSA